MHGSTQKMDAGELREFLAREYSHSNESGFRGRRWRRAAARCAKLTGLPVDAVRQRAYEDWSEAE
jgi:hypothetical protein